MSGRVLTIAESDSCGGSGIQADIKTILALGGYATTALTGVTAQNTLGIKSFQMLDPSIVAEQINAVISDIGTDAVKIGILNSEIVVDTVADILDGLTQKGIPVVIDPSLVAGSGQLLCDETTIAAIKRRLLVRASVVTPNIEEAAHLSGMRENDMSSMRISDIEGLRHAATMMRSFGVETVVLKAGQLTGDKVIYFVASGDGERIYERPQVQSPHTLGAGCTLASAIAVSLAQGMNHFRAVERALDFLHQAILHAPGYGAGRGPINHAFNIERHQTFFQPEHIKVVKA